MIKDKAMHHESETPVKRRPVNLTIREDVIASAKELGLNASKMAEAGIIEAVRKAKEQAWLAENKGAIDVRNARIEKEGMILPSPQWLE
jgi:antitoxin CcdA